MKGHNRTRLGTGLCVLAILVSGMVDEAYSQPPGQPWLVYGFVCYSDGSVPDSSEVDFQAWVTTRPGEVLDPDDSYTDQTWVRNSSRGCSCRINTSDFETDWISGDTLHVHFEADGTSGPGGPQSGDLYVVLDTSGLPNYNQTWSPPPDYPPFYLSPTPDFVDVTLPEADDIWYIGDPATITWTSEGVAGNVKVELWRNSTWTTLSPEPAGAPNTGSFTWPAVTGPAATGCKIRVSDIADGTPADTSGEFAIQDPPTEYITVTVPTAGETWWVGETKTIAWISQGTIPNVKIELWRNSTWTPLYPSTENDGTQDWTVTAPAAAGCKIRVSDAADNTPSGESGTFTIAQPTITVTSPAAGETWWISDTKTIVWTWLGPIANVKIELWRNSAWTTLFPSIPNDGSENWVVTAPAAAGCKIRVSDAADNTPSGESGTFTIAQPTITVTSPAVGETWWIGDTEAIQWTSQGVTGNVKIELWRNGTWSTLIASTQNDWTENWTVIGPEATGCKVRISDAADGVPSGESGQFNIDTPFIDITNPADGDTFRVGESITVSWTSGGTTGNVRIEWRPAGGSWTVLASSTPDDGTFTWTVTNPQNSFQEIRISDTDGSPSDTVQFWVDGLVPVEFASLAAEGGPDYVTVRWHTLSEKDNFGFWVWRSPTESGDYERVNSTIIPGSGTTAEPQSYCFTDENLAAGTYWYRVEDVSLTGESTLHGPISAVVGAPIPTSYSLAVSPNPAHETATLRFELPKDSRVVLSVHDVAGNLVAVLSDEQMPVGTHTIEWTLERVPAGVFFCRINAGEFTAVQKIVVVR